MLLRCAQGFCDSQPHPAYQPPNLTRARAAPASPHHSFPGILTQASCCWCKPVPGSQPHLWMRMVLPHENVMQPSSPQLCLSGAEDTTVHPERSLGLSGEYSYIEALQCHQTCPELAKNSGLVFI